MRDHDLDVVGTSTSASGEQCVWKKIWKLPVMPKVCNFFWKVVRNGLPTNANRCYKHITNVASCEICGAECEDCYHAVMVCPHAKALRDAMREVWSLPPEDGLRNAGPEWLLAVVDSVSTEEVANLDMVLLRAWSVRNKVTQGG
jgi:hypothetical protein